MLSCPRSCDHAHRTCNCGHPPMLPEHATILPRPCDHARSYSPEYVIMLPRPCDHAPQTMHATMLPDHVIIFPGSCNNAPESNGNFLQIMIMLPDHVTMFYIMLPGLGHVTTSCTHNQAVTYLPHAHTLGQSPPSHRHTLSGSHHPPTGTHSRAVTTLPQAHTLGESP